MFGLLLVLLCILAPHPYVCDASAQDEERGLRRVLVLGGTQFMGRLLVERLLDSTIEDHGEQYDVTIMNRGVTNNPFLGDKRVHHLRCDRINGREDCVTRLQSAPWVWDAIVDFTAFHPLQIQDLRIGLTRIDAVTGEQFLAVRQYVYISSDSIYMSTAAPMHDGYVKEADNIVPDPSYISYLKSKNEYQYNYGNLKRECELSLDGQGGLLPFPYTVLRLPDVFGPYDNQGAWPELQNIIMNSDQGVPAGIDSNVMRRRPGASHDWQQLHDTIDVSNLTFSIVYGPDVATALIQVLRKGFTGVRDIYNVADDDPVSLLGLLQTIGASLSKEQINIDFRSRTMIPSTDFGPLNVSKFMKAYPDWHPTPRKRWAIYLAEWYRDPLHMTYHRDIRYGAGSSRAAEASDRTAEPVPKKKKKKKRKRKQHNSKKNLVSVRRRKKKRSEL